jgi:hypothetical protein
VTGAPDDERDLLVVTQCDLGGVGKALLTPVDIDRDLRAWRALDDALCGERHIPLGERCFDGAEG